MKYNSAGSILIMAISVSTLCSIPANVSTSNSNMLHSYGIISQYDDNDGQIAISSKILTNDCWQSIKQSYLENFHRVEKVKLKITKVSKYVPNFDFVEEYDEI